jgi:hypothetical protein
VDDLTFTLTNSGPSTCSVEAKSRSRLWYVSFIYSLVCEIKNRIETRNTVLYTGNLHVLCKEIRQMRH